MAPERRHSAHSAGSKESHDDHDDHDVEIALDDLDDAMEALAAELGNGGPAPDASARARDVDVVASPELAAVAGTLNDALEISDADRKAVEAFYGSGQFEALEACLGEDHLDRDRPPQGAGWSALAALASRYSIEKHAKRSAPAARPRDFKKFSPKLSRRRAGAALRAPEDGFPRRPTANHEERAHQKDSGSVRYEAKGQATEAFLRKVLGGHFVFEHQGLGDEMLPDIVPPRARKSASETTTTRPAVNATSTTNGHSQVDSMTCVELDAGQALRHKSDAFFVVEEGELEATRDGDSVSLRAGDTLGEAALFACGDLAAVRVLATQASVLWTVRAARLRRLLAASAKLRLASFVGSLHRVALLAPLSESDRAQVARALHPRAFGAGERIVEQGDEKDRTFYILVSGHVVCSHDDANGPRSRVVSSGGLRRAPRTRRPVWFFGGAADDGSFGFSAAPPGFPRTSFGSGGTAAPRRRIETPRRRGRDSVPPRTPRTPIRRRL